MKPTPKPEVRCRVGGCGVLLVHGASVAARMCVECRSRAARRWFQLRRVYGKAAAPTKALAAAERVGVLRPH